MLCHRIAALTIGLAAFATGEGTASAAIDDPDMSEAGEVVKKSAYDWRLTYPPSLYEVGEFYQYLPHWVSGDSAPIVVLVHGSPDSDQDADDWALEYIERSTEWADAQQVILIAPIFGTTRFDYYRELRGTRIYRNFVPNEGDDADRFLNIILDGYQQDADEGVILPFEVPEGIMLYGHSGGGQFASRYLAKHAERVAACVLSSPRNLTFPFGDPFNEGSASPAGANFPWAVLNPQGNTMSWPRGPDSGSWSNPYSGTYDLTAAQLDAAWEVPSMIVTSSVDEVAAPPGQTLGEVHRERALTWAYQMGADWDQYTGQHASVNSQVPFAQPFFEEQPAIAAERHRHWWASLL